MMIRDLDPNVMLLTAERCRHQAWGKACELPASVPQPQVHGQPTHPSPGLDGAATPPRQSPANSCGGIATWGFTNDSLSLGSFHPRLYAAAAPQLNEYPGCAATHRPWALESNRFAVKPLRCIDITVSRSVFYTVGVGFRRPGSRSAPWCTGTQTHQTLTGFHV